MNRAKAFTADVAIYPLWIAFLILLLIWRIRVRLAASSGEAATDGWLDAPDHEQQRRATERSIKPMVQ